MNLDPTPDLILRPNEVAFNPNSGDFYVADGFSNSVFVIDGRNNAVIKNIPVR
jgi:YVTN family beta-propeller protein